MENLYIIVKTFNHPRIYSEGYWLILLIVYILKCLHSVSFWVIIFLKSPESPAYIIGKVL